MKIIHVTDTHVVAAGRTLNGINPLCRLEIAVESINAEHADAELVIFSGDVTNRGTSDAYKSFRTAVDALHVPYVLMVGNHDNVENLMECFPKTGQDANGFVQHTIKNDQGSFILCDTSSGLGEAGHYGVYCSARCAWLSEQLAEAENNAYIFMHHPPMDTHTPVDNIKLKNEDDVYQTIRPYADKIRFMFFGHTHRNTCGLWRGIPYKILTSTCHQGVLTIGDSKGVFPINFETPFYGVIMLDGADVVYHTHTYASTVPEIRTSAWDKSQMAEDTWEEYCKNIIAQHPHWFDYT